MTARQAYDRLEARGVWTSLEEALCLTSKYIAIQTIEEMDVATLADILHHGVKPMTYGDVLDTLDLILDEADLDAMAEMLVSLKE